MNDVGSDTHCIAEEVVSRSMAGDETPYTHLPFFYSDLFDLGYEAVGEMDPRTEIVADWKEQFRTGVIYYMTYRKVRGVLLGNVWGQVDAARHGDGRAAVGHNGRGRLSRRATKKARSESRSDRACDCGVTLPSRSARRSATQLTLNLRESFLGSRYPSIRAW